MFFTIRLENWYKILGLFMCCFCWVLIYICKLPLEIVSIFEMTTLISFVIISILINKMKNRDKNKDLVRIEKLVEWLKHNNITKAKDINLLREHFSKKIPIEIKQTKAEKFKDLFIITIGILEIGTITSNNTINFEIISSLVINAIAIVILYEVFLLFWSFFKPSLIDNIYSKLEEDLLYIYINYNKYKNKLSK